MTESNAHIVSLIPVSIVAITHFKYAKPMKLWAAYGESMANDYWKSCCTLKHTQIVLENFVVFTAFKKNENSENNSDLFFDIL